MWETLSQRSPIARPERRLDDIQGCRRSGTAPANGAYESGLRALKTVHRGKVVATRGHFTGSIDIDGALVDVPAHAQASRWDYGIGYCPPVGRENAMWVEVHPAHTSNVRDIVNKLHWLKAYLRSSAPQLEDLTRSVGSKPFVWLATAGVHIPPTTRQARMLRQQGLDLPRRRLNLP